MRIIGPSNIAYGRDGNACLVPRSHSRSRGPSRLHPSSWEIDLTAQVNPFTAEERDDLLAEVDKPKAEAYQSLGEKEARRVCRKKHGIVKERHFMRGLHDISCIIAVRIGLAMDQRRGEVFALTRGDVDPDEGTIHVGHNVTYKDVARRPRRPLASALSPSTRRPWSTFASGRNARQQSSKRTASSKPTRRQYAAQAREATATSTTSAIRGI